MSREKPDPVLEALAKELAGKMGLGEMVAELPLEFGGGKGRGEGLAFVGPLVCRALLSASGADIVLLNEGAVREGLGGAVAFEDVLECLPFRDSLYELLLDGSEIIALASRLARRGGFPLGAGLSVQAVPGPSGGLEVVGVLDGEGALLNPSRRCKLAISGQMLRRARLVCPLGESNCRELGLVERIFAKGLAGLSREAVEAAALAPPSPLVLVG